MATLNRNSRPVRRVAPTLPTINLRPTVTPANVGATDNTSFHFGASTNYNPIQLTSSTPRPIHIPIVAPLVVPPVYPYNLNTNPPVGGGGGGSDDGGSGSGSDDGSGGAIDDGSQAHQEELQQASPTQIDITEQEVESYDPIVDDEHEVLTPDLDEKKEESSVVVEDNSIHDTGKMFYATGDESLVPAKPELSENEVLASMGLRGVTNADIAIGAGLIFGAIFLTIALKK